MTIEPGPITAEELERRRGCAGALLVTIACWIVLAAIAYGAFSLWSVVG